MSPTPVALIPCDGRIAVNLNYTSSAETLAAVLHERAALARCIGVWKRQHGLAAMDPAREAAMQAELGNLAPREGFDAAALQRIFAVVFRESRTIVAAAGDSTPTGAG